MKKIIMLLPLLTLVGCSKPSEMITDDKRYVFTDTRIYESKSTFAKSIVVRSENSEVICYSMGIATFPMGASLAMSCVKK